MTEGDDDEELKGEKDCLGGLYFIARRRSPGLSLEKSLACSVVSSVVVSRYRYTSVRETDVGEALDVSSYKSYHAPIPQPTSTDPGEAEAMIVGWKLCSRVSIIYDLQS